MSDITKFNTVELKQIEANPLHPRYEEACDELDKRSGLDLRAQDEELKD